jgi:hypothetical protein
MVAGLWHCGVHKRFGDWPRIRVAGSRTQSWPGHVHTGRELHLCTWFPWTRHTPKVLYSNMLVLLLLLVRWEFGVNCVPQAPHPCTRTLCCYSSSSAAVVAVCIIYGIPNSFIPNRCKLLCTKFLKQICKCNAQQ